MLSFFEQKIFGLEVSVAHAKLMQMLNTFQNLVEELGRIDIVNPVISDNIIKQLTCISVLHN